MKNLAFILLAVSLSATTAYAAKPKASKAATKVEDLSQYRYDAEEALMMYDVDRADEIVDTWQSKLSKNKKATEEPKELKNLQNRIVTMRNMLERVEQIVIVDSISVDVDDFFKYYRLAADAGHIGGTAERTTFMPASGREEFFTDHNDETGKLRIMYAGILDDGSREDAADTGLAVGNGDVAYPFMLADGMTLYFASNADVDGSLGGYDIYMTRRNEDEGGFFEPTNVGMPYNSPGNDYMLAIDETTGLGWWATDRNAEDGKVTIYVYVPNDTRQNYDPERSDITDLAFISSVAATQPEGFNAQAKLAALDNLGTSVADDSDTQFALSLGNGKVYHSLSEFRNSEARNMMSTYLSELSAYNTRSERLRTLRRQYAEGNLTLTDRISAAETDLDNARGALLSRRNAVIKLELQK
jgi:hypothetical protein